MPSGSTSRTTGHSLWAANCAQRVLPYFEEHYPEDDRPRKALEAGRAWARGELSVSKARTAGHARHAAAYAVNVAAAAAIPTDAGTAAARERDWQRRRLPGHLRTVALPPARHKLIAFEVAKPRCSSGRADWLSVSCRASSVARH
jgi:hypothetical protein